MKESYTLCTLAKIAIALQLFILVKDILLYFQNYYMIVSPIIPADLVNKLMRNERVILFAMAVSAILPFIFFRKKKYIVCIVIALLMLLLDTFGREVIG